MKNLLSRVGALALVLILPCAALAQAPVGKSIQAPSGYLPAEAIYCDDGTGHAALCNFGSGGSGGGGGGTSAAVSRISYVATASGTGYSAGDQVERIVTTSPTTGGIIASYWIDVTAGGLLTSAPIAGNITLKPDTITNTVFGAMQSGAWNVGILGSVTVTGAFFQAIQPVSLASMPLPTGASTAAAQAANTAAIVAAQAAPGTIAGTGQTVTMVLPQLATTSRSGLFGTTAAQLMPANPTRHFIQVQVQNTATCYINGSVTATIDQNSLLLPGSGQLFESTSHVGTGAISIICSAASTPVYAREG